MYRSMEEWFILWKRRRIIIQCEGGYLNGKSDGNGKYIYEDGRYNIGEYKKGLELAKENFMM